MERIRNHVERRIKVGRVHSVDQRRILACRFKRFVGGDGLIQIDADCSDGAGKFNIRGHGPGSWQVSRHLDYLDLTERYVLVLVDSPLTVMHFRSLNVAKIRPY